MYALHEILIFHSIGFSYAAMLPQVLTLTISLLVCWRVPPGMKKKKKCWLKLTLSLLLTTGILQHKTVTLFPKTMFSQRCVLMLILGFILNIPRGSNLHLSIEKKQGDPSESSPTPNGKGMCYAVLQETLPVHGAIPSIFCCSKCMDGPYCFTAEIDKGWPVLTRAIFPNLKD